MWQANLNGNAPYLSRRQTDYHVVLFRPYGGNLATNRQRAGQGDARSDHALSRANETQRARGTADEGGAAAVRVVEVALAGTDKASFCCPSGCAVRVPPNCRTNRTSSESVSASTVNSGIIPLPLEIDAAIRSSEVVFCQAGSVKLRAPTRLPSGPSPAPICPWQRTHFAAQSCIAATSSGLSWPCGDVVAEGNAVADCTSLGCPDASSLAGAEARLVSSS